MKSIISKLYNLQVNSKLARGALGLYYRHGRVYSLPFGPLRGVKLRYETSVNFHAVLGLWELASFRFLSRVLVEGGLLAPDSVACDVGANIGMYSLWLARIALPKGRIYSFEIAPVTLERLRDNLKLNQVQNVEVVAAACADKNGPVEFFVGDHHHCNSLNAEWAGGHRITPEKLIVKGITLDEFFYGSEPRRAPAFIKMDIEGGGVFALKGCNLCCERARPFILIESHTPEEDLAISDIAIRHKYVVYQTEENRWVKRPDRGFPDPEGIRGTVFLCPVEKRSALERILGV